VFFPFFSLLFPSLDSLLMFYQQVPLRYSLRPKLLNIQYHAPANFQGTPPTFPNPIRVHFYSPIGGVLEKLGVPLEGCGIYLLNESTGTKNIKQKQKQKQKQILTNSTK
jgi:hypothetical protein